MLTKDDAYVLVERELSKWGPLEDPVIIKDATEEYPWGWVIFYQSKRFLETGNVSHIYIGNLPYIVNRHTGEIEMAEAALTTEEIARNYERKIGEA